MGKSKTSAVATELRSKNMRICLRRPLESAARRGEVYKQPDTSRILILTVDDRLTGEE